VSVPEWHEVTDRKFRSWPYAERQRRVRQMKKWCQEHAGTDGIFWRSKLDRSNQPTQWLFRDPGTAMMFNMVRM
jgi:hypothetical protein